MKIDAADLMARMMAAAQELEVEAQKTDEELIYAKMQSRRFRAAHPVTKPAPVVTMQSMDGQSVTISTAGNLTAFFGYKKVGKSGAFGGLLGGALRIRGDVGVDQVGFDVVAADGAAVVHFDTEQSDYDHHRFCSNVLKRTSRSGDPDWFHSYNLRPYAPGERREQIRAILKKVFADVGRIHIIVIDGVADLVDSVNDEAESNAAVAFLEQMAVQYDCPVVTALHLNPGSDKPRGHVGSQIERKAESLLKLVKDADRNVTQIQEAALRNGSGIATVEFAYDSDAGYHTLVGLVKTIPRTGRRTRPEDWSDAEHRDNASNLFSVADELTGPQLVESIKLVYQVGKSRAEQLRRWLVERGLIHTNDQPSNSPLLRYSLTPFSYLI